MFISPSILVLGAFLGPTWHFGFPSRGARPGGRPGPAPLRPSSAAPEVGYGGEMALGLGLMFGFLLDNNRSVLSSKPVD